MTSSALISAIASADGRYVPGAVESGIKTLCDAELRRVFQAMAGARSVGSGELARVEHAKRIALEEMAMRFLTRIPQHK
jgi:hypothetical protein